MDKLLLIDGSNLLFQMFYGMPDPIADKDGRDIRGAFGFIGALRKILQMTRPTHMAVLFDGECQNVRKELDAQYKANRPDWSQMPPEQTPFCQLPDIFRALELLQIPFAQTQSCECDDWMAGYCHSYPQVHTVICSQDSDFFQLISPNTCVLRYRADRSVVWGEDYLQQKLGIRPEQYALYKSLTGDSADNIPGIRGVGPKTAAALLQQFGDLEGLLAGAQQIAKPSIRAAITENAQRLRLNHALVCLSGAPELPFSLEQLRFTGSVPGTWQVLRQIGCY